MFQIGTCCSFPRSRSRGRGTIAIRRTLRRSRNRWSAPPEASAAKTDHRKLKPRPTEVVFRGPRMKVRRPNPALTASRPSDLVGDSFVLVAAFGDGDGDRRRLLRRPRRRCSVLDRRREECRNTWRNLKW